MSSLPAPRYENDHDDCVYLGQWCEYDLYFCEQGGVAKTVIARYGEEGDYISGWEAGRIDGGLPALVVARAAATAMGLAS